MKCPDCRGRGKISRSGEVCCPSCSGAGRHMNFVGPVGFGEPTICNQCSGSGRIYASGSSRCERCNGSGKVADKGPKPPVPPVKQYWVPAIIAALAAFAFLHGGNEENAGQAAMGSLVAGLVTLRLFPYLVFGAAAFFILWALTKESPAYDSATAEALHAVARPLGVSSPASGVPGSENVMR